MTTHPRGTDLLDKATELVDEHLDPTDAGRALADHAGGDRDALYAAYLEYLQRAPGRHFDVFHATAVLGVIEEALALVPAAPPTQERSGRRRRRPWRRRKGRDG